MSRDQVKDDDFSEDDIRLLFKKPDTYYGLDFSRFIELCHATYLVICANSSSFQDKVSFGFYLYYMTTALHIRRSIFDGTPFYGWALRILKFTPVMCRVLFKYMKNIGIVVDPAGQFSSPARRNFLKASDTYMGSFDVFRQDTLYLYQTDIAPIMPLLKILNDFRFTKGTHKSKYWKLPAVLNNIAPLPFKPNAFILGYSPSERLTETQMTLLVDWLFTENTLYTETVLNYPFHLDLLRHVHKTLDETLPTHLKHDLPRNVMGSLSIIPYIRWNVRPTDITDRFYSNIKKDTFQTTLISPYSELDLATLLEASIFQYRVQRCLKPAEGELDIAVRRMGCAPHRYSCWLTFENSAFYETIEWMQKKFTIPSVGNKNMSLTDFVQLTYSHRI